MDGVQQTEGNVDYVTVPELHYFDPTKPVEI